MSACKCRFGALLVCLSGVFAYLLLLSLLVLLLYIHVYICMHISRYMYVYIHIYIIYIMFIEKIETAFFVSLQLHDLLLLLLLLFVRRSRSPPLSACMH